MKWTVEDSLQNFEFWSSAKSRAEKLTAEQFDIVESNFEDMYPEGMTDTEINDFFWFEFDTIAEWLGYKNEECFDEDISNEDISDAENFENELSINEMIEFAQLQLSDYIDEETDEIDEDECRDDFQEWFDNLGDIEKVKFVRQFE